MGVISGTNLAINGEETARRFSLSSNNKLAAGVASNTQRGMLRRPGVKDWKGSYGGYGHTPAVFPGADFTFTGSLTGSQGATGEAICSRIVMNWDIERGELIAYRVYFEANGDLTFGAAAASDSSIPDPPTTQAMFIALDGGQQTQIRNMDLDISCRNRPYVTSDTDGDTKREPGNFDFLLRYGMYFDSDTVTLPTLETAYIAKMYVTASTFWELKWARIESVLEFQGDHEKDEPASCIVTAAMDASDGAAIGSITNPASSVVWPV